MALSLKDPETGRLARAIAALTGETLTTAVRKALAEGRHRARLNIGDCFAYALAKATGLPLLFKGGDFALTDIAAVLPS